MLQIKVKDFDLEQTLTCGQIFRFHEKDEGYNIIAHGNILYAYQKGEILNLKCTEEEYETIWKTFFDIERRYDEIKNIISSNDKIMKEAISFAPGIRLITQDPYECLIHFIISSNNRIPQIKAVIENLSKSFGKEIKDGIFSFPSAEELYNASLDAVLECKPGFRAKYIKDAAKKIYTENLDLGKIKNLPFIDARAELMKINGVGVKVADCALLFSMQKYESFPTDVWVKRIMEQFYFGGNETKIQDILSFANEKWGNNAGFAQQYLFFYAKENKVGKK